MRVTVMFLMIMLSSITLANPIAMVVRVKGDVLRITTSEQTNGLSRRDVLEEGDRIRTADNAYVTLKFDDDSVIDLAENTELKISRYRPDEAEESRFLLELLNGKLRTITGTISKDPDAFELKTAHASIGVRGTEFEVNVVSASETQVQQHAGTVLVRSLEFQGQILELTADAPLATVTLGSPAEYLENLTQPSMGPFESDLLGLINDFSLLPPPLIPIPAVVPLSAEVSGPAGADESDSAPLGAMETLVSLVDQQQWREARIVADELQERFEGLPRYDLYNGLVLMSEQSYDEAIFSFERVLIFNPNQHRARLELGRAYYLSGNYSRSRDALEQVLAANPPAPVARSVRSLLARVSEAEQSTQLQTDFGGLLLAGWDSNANNGSQLDEPLDANLLGLTELADVSAAEASAYIQWSVFTGAYQPTSQTSGNRFNVDFTNKNFLKVNLPDSSALTLSGQSRQQGRLFRTTVPVSAQWSWLNGQSWQARVNVGLSQQVNVWGPLWAGVKIGTDIAIGVNEESATSAKDLAGLVFDAQERGRVHTLSSLYLQTQQAGQDDEHVEWRGLANRYQLSWSLPWNLQALISAEHQWRRYKAEDLLFTVNDSSTALKLRQDQVISANAQLSWTATNWLIAQSTVSWENVDSNINAYRRNRLTVSQAIRVSF